MGHIRQLTNLVPQPLRFELRRRAFAGQNTVCALCGNGVRKLVDHGGGTAVLERRRVVGGMRRSADRCPVCHSSDRTRLLSVFLKNETPIGREPIRLLHVAPDFGLYLWLKKQPKLEYVGIDIDAGLYRHIEGMRRADLTQTPSGDSEFDIIVCPHVLEHVPDDASALNEMFRILKPGGVALLLTPLATDGAGTDENGLVLEPAARHERFGQWDHVRLHDRNDSLRRMVEAGFEAELYDPFVAEPDGAEALSLNPLGLLPVGRKPLVQ